MNYTLLLGFEKQKGMNYTLLLGFEKQKGMNYTLLLGFEKQMGMNYILLLGFEKQHLRSVLALPLQFGACCIDIPFHAKYWFLKCPVRIP
jgi:hypothetical protein